MSPSQIAVELNNKSIPGPRAAAWRDTAIRGHIDRGTGILNNELYLGRTIWNRREYRKNPDTERKIARHSDTNDWVVDERPELRIIPDDLWSAVKRRQASVRHEFARTDSNRLNRAHRPRYLLSGLLECAECGGPYAIMATDRYGCTNHRKSFPWTSLAEPLAAITRQFFAKNLTTVSSHPFLRPWCTLMSSDEPWTRELTRQLTSAPSMDKPISDAERLTALRKEINEDTVRAVVHTML